MILLCDVISIFLFLRKESTMTKNEFISLAAKHDISVSELSGHLCLAVLDSEFKGWKCETNQYRDEVMKWLLSFHPHEVLLALKSGELSVPVLVRIISTAIHKSGIRTVTNGGRLTTA